MSQSVVPRPIAWVVSESAGRVNVAPFSYFTPLSSQPPVVALSVGHKKDGTPKDTLYNLTATRKATICTVSEAHLKKMHLSGTSHPIEESEAAVYDIPTERVRADYPPIITGCDSALFCTLYQTVDLPGSKTIPLILEVQAHYLREGLAGEDLAFVTKAVGRVGRAYQLPAKELIKL
jgi:flavin reductase (DIM6/NTAB) family NADH-FMN oxidoreductase RutF